MVQQIFLEKGIGSGGIKVDVVVVVKGKSISGGARVKTAVITCCMA